MGNQALVPSQIQSVESYLLDLKNYIQFRQSLGSTTFMKTAKVNLIENYDDFMMDSSLDQMISNLNQTLSLTNNNNNNDDQTNQINPSSTNLNTSSSNTNSTLTTGGSIVNVNNMKFYQQQLMRQKLQYLRELQQQVVVKIFPKYDMSIRLDLYTKRVREIKNIIHSRYGPSTNCLPYFDLIITDRAAFLFRQYVKYNLYDRLSTRPFLTMIEKKWLAFQLLCAVNEIHSLQIVHGDMKTENVLVNSFLWVSLADFASYKPVYLSKNHPSADFNYYFDISRRRTCYLAPERLDLPNKFNNNQHQSPNSTNNYLNQQQTDTVSDNLYEMMPPDPNDFKTSMDIFSLGCVIAELFMERPLFDFSHLLAYREKKYDPMQELVNEIGDKHILEMLSSMLSLDPSERKSANQYLQEQNDKAFPSYFVYLKNYTSRFINVSMSPDDIVIKLRNDLPILLKNFKLNLNEEEELVETENDKVSSSPTLLVNNNDPNLKTTNNQNTNDAFLILLSLLLSTIRKLKFTENKLVAIDLMTSFSKFLDDSIVLDRVLPYYLSLIDPKQQQSQTQSPSHSLSSPIVKSHVIYALNDCLANIINIDVQNLNIFPELIFDYLELLSKDESFLVRSTVAKTISNFALTSLRYLDTVFLTKRSFLTNKDGNNNKDESNDNLINNNDSNNNLSEISTNQENQSNLNINNIAPNNNNLTSNNDFDKDKEKFPTYEKEYEYYQFRITEIVMHLITDITGSPGSNAVKETLIRSDISKLCSFFSRQITSEFLLPHMITILNEKTDWSVRAAFFDALCPVLAIIGWESVDIVKSLLEQGLRDSEEFVIYRTLITLSKMVEIGLLDRQQICYFLSNHIAPFLCHPSLWIRHGSVNFITTVCRQKSALNGTGFNTADILCSVAPILTKFLLRSDLISFDKEEILFNCLKQPIIRTVYDRISQDGQSDQLFIYLQQRSDIRCLTNQNYLPGYVDCTDPNVQEFFEKLRKLGFIEEDEDKLLHLKEFMDKTRISRLSSSLHNTDMMSASNNSTTSVLNASNLILNPKDNFALKDGFITIMKEKFQKCNCEYLNTRKEASVAGLFYQNSLDNPKRLEKNKQDDSNSNNSNINFSQSNQANEVNLNAEWKLMFGTNRSNSYNNTQFNAENSRGEANSNNNSVNEASPTNNKSLTRQKTSTKNSPNDVSSSTMLVSPTTTSNSNKTKQKTNLLSNIQHSLNSNNLYRRHTDCTIEVEKYLDLMKFIYDEDRLKQQRVAKFKETISSSISSNTICLSSSIGKWKPKGFILAHSNEHTKEINRLCRNPDANYFASCSTSESVVKIWSTDNLLDGKSGYFKSIFTYDRQSAATRDSTVSNMDHTLNRPCCISFYNSNSLAILCEDFKFYVIDFNSNRTQYRLYSNEKLFRSTVCKNCTLNDNNISQQFDKQTFYYLTKLNKISKSPKMCLCTSNYPIEMIRIDDSSPSWPAAANNFYEYHLGNRSSNVRGLFCYSTSTGDFSCIDMRTRSKAFDVRRDLRRGYITAMITDPWYTWLACGTSTGDIEIYDFRFMQPIQQFQHRSRTSVVKLCNHPMSNNRLIASYQGNNEICIWNINSQLSKNSAKSISSLSSASTKYTRQIIDPEFVYWGVQSVPPLSQNKISSYYISGLIGCSAGEENGSNGLICASTDMKMRYIDLNDSARDSYIISSAFNFQQNSKMSSDLSSQQQQQVNAASAAASNASTTSNSGQAASAQTSSLRGNEFANSLITSSVNYEIRTIEGNKVLLEFDQQSQLTSSSASSSSATYSSYNSPALAHQSYFTHHQDAITDLIVCYNPSNTKNQPLIVTSARDGALKIWR